MGSAEIVKTESARGGRGTESARRAAAVGSVLLGLAVGALLSSCVRADAPVREPVRLDPRVPFGRIEGDTFIGTQVPVTLSTAGTGWRISTTYPAFLLEQGYDAEGLRQSQVFAFNPETESSLQVSLSPAGPHATFSQETIEWITAIAHGSVDAELDADSGAGDYEVTHGPVTPFALRGVTYAARSYSVIRKGSSREVTGWIFGFAEPFQIFVLYQIEGSDATGADARAVEAIVSSFEYTGLH